MEGRESMFSLLQIASSIVIYLTIQITPKLFSQGKDVA